ncbi:hypothetical protein F5144DRAFT_606274 [Chaetomium tenue]|uniref:Uncharacterized protein n=1 Tax=Chaetomium tenue TaxID=1854479 RepID=A0ACB7P0C8_9PEZI|nr:hypothetical protein F5144DRAFT_606274 [Chaetomium globosum]
MLDGFDPSGSRVEEEPGVSKSPMSPYRIVSFTTSNEDDSPQWFALEIKLHASRFRISVSPCNFHNSAVRCDEFQKHFALLRSELDGNNGSVEESDSDKSEKDVPDDTSLINDCFDWAVIPCLSNFERLSPPPPPLKKGEQLTLDHFLTTTSFECDLLAIELLDDDTDDEYPWPSSPTVPRAWTTTFPSFHPSEITVICDNPTHPLDTNPTHVLHNHHPLHFKEAFDPDDTTTKAEVATYEKLALAALPPDVRTSRLYGVVRHAKNQQLLGLLLHRIEEDAPLTVAVGPQTPRVVRERWARQVRETVAALHAVGVVWGDAKAGNVLVDVKGDAWVVDFGGGRTEGWVDEEWEGTVQGDGQGVERIVEFIERGGRETCKLLSSSPSPKVQTAGISSLSGTLSRHHDIGPPFGDLDVQLRVMLVQVAEANDPVKLMFSQEPAEILQEMGIAVLLRGRVLSLMEIAEFVGDEVSVHQTERSGDYGTLILVDDRAGNVTDVPWA